MRVIETDFLCLDQIKPKKQDLRLITVPQNRLNQKTVNSVCLVSEHANEKVKDNLTSVFEPLHCTSELCISKPVAIKYEVAAPDLTNNELSVQSPLFLSWHVINQLILILCLRVCSVFVFSIAVDLQILFVSTARKSP